MTVRNGVYTIPWLQRRRLKCEKLIIDGQDKISLIYIQHVKITTQTLVNY